MDSQSVCALCLTLRKPWQLRENAKDRDSVYRIEVGKSRAEAKQLSQTNNESSTNCPQMIMTDHLKQVLITGSNQWSEDQCQQFITQEELHSLKE